MAYQLLAVAGQKVDYGDFNHGVASGLLTHRCACNVYEHLTCQGRVVDAHVELHALVLSLSANALAHEVYAVAHVLHSVNAVNLHNVSLVACEIRVGLWRMR